MDEQKKQKVMIGVLAVAILGAGTFFWMNSRPKSNSDVQQNTGPVQRRTRTESSTASKEPDRRERSEPVRRTAEQPTATRRERQETQDVGATRRNKGRQENRKEKKQDIKPLG